MKNQEHERREFLRLLAALPVVLAVGCEGKQATLDADESLRKLIRLLGPWKDRAAAADFTRRFLGAESAVAPYLPDGGRSLQLLAARFPDDAMAVETADLTGVSEQERNVLLALTGQLYSLVEVRFLVSGEPPWGECGSGDPLRYTRAPE